MENKSRFINKKKMDNKLKIFNNNISNKYKLIPFNKKLSDYREKYEPAVSKEWKNTAYFYNQNNLKNIPSNDVNINKMIKSYFNLRFKNKFIHLKHMSLKRKRSLLKRIYVSNVEIKHTNNKAIITLYVLNTQKKKLFQQYLKGKAIYKWIRFCISRIQKNIFKQCISYYRNLLINFNPAKFIRGSRIFKFKWIFLNKIINDSNKNFHAIINKMFKKYKFVRKMQIVRRKIVQYKLSKVRFDRVSFLHILNNRLEKILNKKIEYNIVNLRSFLFNPDIFTKALALKLRKKRFFIMRGMNSILRRARIPHWLTIRLERADLKKFKDLNLVHNKYKESNLFSILKKNEDFFMYLQNIYNIGDQDFTPDKWSYIKGSWVPSYKGISNNEDERDESIKQSMFDSIKHRELRGIRLEVKGRLTRRNRADRSVFKYKWKGGLKNTESSFNNLSSVLYRGHFKPNVLYSMNKSKRRVGAFAVKGWISSK